jgi:AP-3 complex subunit beta
MTPFFSAVVKNVASANLEVKKLVYIYLVHHAEAEPDLALCARVDSYPHILS